MSTILLVDNAELITEIVGDQLSDNTEFGGYIVIKASTRCPDRLFLTYMLQSSA